MADDPMILDILNAVNPASPKSEPEQYDGKAGRETLRKIAWGNVKKLLDEKDVNITKMVLTDVFWPGEGKPVGRPRKNKPEDPAPHEALINDESDKPLR